MNLVTVRTFDNYFTANITLTKLHAAGVECYLKDEYTVTMDPMLSNAIGGIKLVVKNSDEALVKQLLADYEAEYLQAAACPRCGGNNFTGCNKLSDSYFYLDAFKLCGGAGLCLPLRKLRV